VWIFGLLCQQSPHIHCRQQLASDQYWDPQVPRYSLFSKSDKLVNWKDVQDHADNAVANGTPAEVAYFNNSGYCRHTKENLELHWDSVITTLKRAAREQSDEKSLQSLDIETMTDVDPRARVS
jgi:excinuclease UvrABC ATPase subunit